MDGDKPVVAGFDGSAAALRAVRWAAAEASLRGAPLRLIMAWSLPPANRFESILAPDARSALLAQSREMLADAESEASRQSPDVEVSADLQTAAAAPALIAASHEAQLLVVGSSGLGGVSGLLVGSVAIATAAHSLCPVVVVRGEDEPDEEERPVVVGLDGTELSDPAVGFAFDNCARRGVDLLAVHVRRGRGDGFSGPPREQAEQSVRAAVTDVLSPWREKHPGVGVHIAVHTGRPQAVLIEQSRKAQLVVVGSRGRGAVAGFALGSVSHALLHRSASPVAIVRAPELAAEPEHAEGPAEQ